VYAYYIPSQRKVFGDATEDTVILLYACYMKHLAPEQNPQPHDGVSIKEGRMILVLNRKASIIQP
jgi:hypothetical protein